MAGKKNNKCKIKFLLIGYIFFLAVFLVSAGILAYPAIASWWNDNHMAKEAVGYQKAMSNLKEVDYTEYLEKARAYNKALLASGAFLTDPFDFKEACKAADSQIGNYDNMLNYSKIMATIEIPSISVELPIFHGTDEKTLTEGIGHLEGSSLPIGGIGTHSVLTGHTGLPGKTLFTNLEKVKMGDIFYIKVMNETLAYEVDNIAVVLPTELSKLALEGDKDYVTLITCTPYGVNDHRLLVRGRRIYPSEKTDENDSETDKTETKEDNIEVKNSMTTVEKIKLYAAIIAIILFVIMAYMMISTIRHYKKGRKKNNDEEE